MTETVAGQGRHKEPHGNIGASAGLSRRRFCALGAGAAALGATSSLPVLVAGARSPLPDGNPFGLGIASGDPLPRAVVLWTRLALNPLEPFGGMPYEDVAVEWQVARDEKFRDVVRDGTTTARPKFVHSVHIDVRGLRPGQEYFYRFRAGGQLSPVGRTKTAPLPGRGGIDRLRFAFASCQAWHEGFYPAYARMAEEDLDLVVHLGDYIYESIPGDGGLRNVEMPEHLTREAIQLDEYRNLYAVYKADPDMQAAHARFPWIVTTDDHEVVNNYAGEHHPSAPPSEFLVRRANAYRAHWEHMPIRAKRMPTGPAMPLYRRFTFSDLAEFNILDTRQYRSQQACSGGQKADCEERFDPERTMLGDDQEHWLIDGLSKSRAQWNVLAQQIIMTRFDRDPGDEAVFEMELWDGYVPARTRLLTALEDREVRNPVVLTGDVHRNYVADLTVDVDDPESTTVATEFIGTSISSGSDGADVDPAVELAMQANPHLVFGNGQRGYVRCEVTREAWHADYRVVPHVSQRDDAPVSTRASFVLETDRPGVQQG